MRKNSHVIMLVILTGIITGCQSVTDHKPSLISATGKPAEGPLETFTGKPVFRNEVVFSDSVHVREPYLAIAADGTILVLRNKKGHLRRSEDGGQSWGEIIEVPFGFLDCNMTVDENTGDIMVVRMWDGTDRLWRSRDNGKTWEEQEINLKPNEVMKWIERAGLRQRGTWEERDDSGKYIMHGNASESGITLRHGRNKGRLLVTATFRPHAKEHPSDRKPPDVTYSCAIYSDDGGTTWQVSGLFPEGYTEEASLAELHDGTIYYNSRSCIGYYNKALARELRPEETLRREAWSCDGGQTWEDLKVSRVLPDGGGYGRGYGLKGGLVRLPVNNRDILIFSNTDTGGGDRKMMTVWASFDGGNTWPLKRLVYEGPAAYSSLGAGRPGTPGEGMIYLLFEGGPEHHYAAMQVASFNLSWILEGEMTGDGEVPQWIKQTPE